MVVPPRFPAKTVVEFIAYAKATSGKLNMGSAGAGTPHHVAGELFKMATGTNLAPVQYRGEAPALADLLGAQVDVVFATLPGSIEYVRAGALRALAIMSATRSPALPEIPAMADFVPGLEASLWLGMVAPKNTSAAIVERLNKEISAALADPTIRALCRPVARSRTEIPLCWQWRLDCYRRPQVARVHRSDQAPRGDGRRPPDQHRPDGQYLRRGKQRRFNRSDEAGRRDRWIRHGNQRRNAEADL
jgi:hypothetical protein